MDNLTSLIFIICWSIAIILFIKWDKIYKLKKNMQLIKCICTDYTYQTKYERNYYIYYYTYIIDNEEYNIGDKCKYKILFKPNINDKLDMYVNLNKTNEVITPFALFKYKLTLISIIILLILPFIFLI